MKYLCVIAAFSMMLLSLPLNASYRIINDDLLILESTSKISSQKGKTIFGKKNKDNTSENSDKSAEQLALESRKFGKISLILAGLSLIPFFLYFTLTSSIIFAFIALNKAKRARKMVNEHPEAYDNHEEILANADMGRKRSKGLLWGLVIAFLAAIFVWIIALAITF